MKNNLSQVQSSDVSISLENIRLFFFKSWKLIIFSGFIGFTASLIYLSKIPISYEATAKVQIAKINRNGSSIFPTENFEDASVLIDRVFLFNDYTPHELVSCNLSLSREQSLFDVATIKKSTTSDSILELKVRMNTQEQAVDCIKILFEKIQLIQTVSLDPYLVELISMREKYTARMTVLENKYYASSLNEAVGREVTFLSDQLLAINKSIFAMKTGIVKLIGPIRVSDHPYKKSQKNKILWFGFIVGCLLASALILIFNIFLVGPLKTIFKKIK